GHLIFTQLHVDSAIGAVLRLREMGVDGRLLAQTLAGAVGTRLVRRVCAECAAPYEALAEVLEPLALTPADGPFRRGTGCAACHGTGYRRRLNLFEVLEVDEPLRRLIAEDAPAAQL